jgi:hypothetical protein
MSPLFRPGGAVGDSLLFPLRFMKMDDGPKLGNRPEQWNC